ncbi:hypothetical protein Gotri_004053 [Gossypium trilobum]|uniref:Uncharacterized protein n=1 Tax=Gossypium trilobum TaxID=34281 RepID=A0A7J9F3J5_9ROSI|nr:hypothetical protein [Gossypium trilobum]
MEPTSRLGFQQLIDLDIECKKVTYHKYVRCLYTDMHLV